ncbi:SGNH hydrolase-type esterase domain-containing protein [Kickxella alabastrina]|uniref:SGNH hydrolase-type esterase domain-containing protein n=1 Tax=Kickxella alabastrina TaxID=61397 RepID=UPI00221EFBC2|nr:SGNH hydrolase-type esterase domain-containing protein [Kickxella alabastrina]KAI7826317.1 SGNH hydrolase-type esterase domain-containing protein [Kickxella alabastrina]
MALQWYRSTSALYTIFPYCNLYMYNSSFNESYTVTIPATSSEPQTLTTPATSASANLKTAPTANPVYTGGMYDVFLALGDSITQLGGNSTNNGWVSLLSHHYRRRMDVLNRGISGYNTEQARKIVESKGIEMAGRDDTFAGATPTVRLMTIFYGANDSAMKPSWRHVPLDVFSANLRYMVSLVSDPESDYYSPETRIVLVTPPALGERMYEVSWKGTSEQGVRKNNNTKLYADAVKEIARDFKLPCVDMWTAVEDKVRKFIGVDPFDGYDEYFVDGMHFSAKGNQLFFDLLTQTISSTWPELRP